MCFSPFPSFLRSSPMKLYSLRLPRETAFTVINHLGELSLLHFMDSSPESPMFSRYYSKSIKRCEECLLKLEDLTQIMHKFKKSPKKLDDIPKFLIEFRGMIKSRNKPETSYLDEVENEINEKYEQLQEQLKIYEDIAKNKSILLEEKVSMIRAKTFIRSHQTLGVFQEEEISLEEGVHFHENKNIQMHYYMGLLMNEDMIRFKRMIFRSSKGNALLFTEDLLPAENPIDAKTLRQKEMGFFLLMFGGGFNDSLKEKLTKIIQSFGSNYFEFPTDPEVFSEKLDNMKKKILELTDTLKLTESHINSLLNYLESPQISCSLIEEYRFFLTKEKYIYTIMNYFKQHDGDVIKVRCWCSLLDEPIVKLTLKTVAKAESHQTAGEFIEIPEKSNEIPPTFFKTNDFLAPFQEIVNTYGIPRYQEINPGLFTIISFPFLFGVMFGDIGHGLLLLSFGIFLCCFQEKMKDLIKIRYLLVLMGFFSVFCGFIYNEIFSLPLNLFGSCYQKTDKIVSRAEDCVYPFGMDPIWAVSTNELAFFNSFKMKLAVILGVSQMILGILIKGANTIRTNNFLDFFFEFLPQIFFMASTFVYLDIMIIIKWCIYWDNAGATSPGLIQQFLNLGLKMGAVDENPLYGTSKEQEFYQTILFFIAMITVPMMLITKPVMIYNSRKKEKETKQKMKKEHQIINRSSGLDLYGDIKEEAKDEDEDEDTEGKAFIERGTEKQLKEVLKSMRDFDSASESSVTKHKSDEPMSEIIVHQIIETIEFVLGSISNTASYLRLWALSLAHSQLSKVFFQKTVLGALEEKNYIGILVGVFVFLNITFAVLMCMDVMECFLHALRLHWVEFQNKFFKADGYKFHPFSYLELYRNELA